MKSLILLIALTFSSVAQATSSEWFCTTQTSQRRGDIIMTCGHGTDEESAFNAAVAEYHRICDISVDCRNHEVFIIPQRTQCSRKYGYCIRSVAFKIEDQMVDQAKEADDAVKNAFAAEMRAYR
jgi:hypothetical protein